MTRRHCVIRTSDEGNERRRRQMVTHNKGREMRLRTHIGGGRGVHPSRASVAAPFLTFVVKWSFCVATGVFMEAPALNRSSYYESTNRSFFVCHELAF
jgi:hypothetical protein